MSTLRGSLIGIFDASLELSRTEEHERLKQAAYNTNFAANNSKTQAEAAAAAVPVPAGLVPWLTAAAQECVAHIAPHKALEKVKRYLRRECRKPHDLSIREWFVAFQATNTQELKHLPPLFDRTQCLSDDEAIDIVLYSIPNSWENEMARQGFDPYRAGLPSTIGFCEQLEMADEFMPVSGRSNKSNKKSRSSGGSKTTGLDCVYHGGNCGHTSGNCRTLKKLAAAKSNRDSDGSSKNKTWSRKADDAKKRTKKDLAAFIKKTIRAEMDSIEKRKADDNEDDDDGSLNLAEADFDNMPIASSVNTDDVEDEIDV